MKWLYKTFIKNYKNTKDAKVAQKYGLLAGIVGIILNIVLFVSKIVIAIISSSVSIISDAFNNLSDASSSLITTLGFKISSKPADKEHPFGHQRVEHICAFIISVIILYIGIQLGVSSFNKILNPTLVEFNYLMIIVLCITILIKTWMAIFYYKTSKKINSLSLKASCRDSFNDVITTFIIVIGLVIGKVFHFNIDGYLGVIVCIYIVISGIGLLKETIDKLIGGTFDNELIEKVKSNILNNYNVLGIHDVLYHNYGLKEVYISMHVEVDSKLTLIEAHELADTIEKNINKAFNVHLLLHIDPVLLEDELLNNLNIELNKIILKIDELLSFHELKVIEKNEIIIISFDLVVPFNFKMKNQEIYKIINSELRQINKNYRASITFDKH